MDAADCCCVSNSKHKLAFIMMLAKRYTNSGEKRKVSAPISSSTIWHSNGVGVTLMPSVAIQPGDEDIKYIEIKQKPSHTIALVWRMTHPRKRLFEELAVLLAYKPIV